MIYVGDKRAVIYHGDHHPAALYKGDQMIAGWQDHPMSGADWSAEDTYNDVLPLEIFGKSWQENYRVGVLDGEIVQFEDGQNGTEVIVTADTDCTVHQRNTLKPFDDQGNILGKHVIPLLCGAGNVCMTVSGLTNYYWVFRNVKYTGTTFSFTRASDGEVLWLVINDDTISRTFQINNEWSSNGTHFKLDLSDLQGKIIYYLNLNNCSQITGDLSALQGKITYLLSLANCTQITGDLSALQGKITYYLNLTSCTQITGDLSDLQGKITYYLDLYNCTQITGDLSDLQGKITYLLVLRNCSQITGDYIPISNIVWTTSAYFNFSGTGQTTQNVDNTILGFASALQTGTGTKTGGTLRTNTSSGSTNVLNAISTIKSYGWSVYCGGVQQ